MVDRLIECAVIKRLAGVVHMDFDEVPVEKVGHVSQSSQR